MYFNFKHFLSESYGYGLFNEMLGRFAFALWYVWIGGGVWIGCGCGTATASSCSWYLKSKLLISNLIFLFFLGDKFPSCQINHRYLELTVMTCWCPPLSLIPYLVFLELVWPLRYVFFALQCLCKGVSNNWSVETLENKLFSEQSLKLSSASVMPSSFGLISAPFVFDWLLTVFSLSLKYGASQLKKSYFLSSVSACFTSRLNRIWLFFCTLLSFYWTYSSNYQIVVSLHQIKRKDVCIIMIHHVQWTGQWNYQSRYLFSQFMGLLINIVLGRYNKFITDHWHI